MTRINLEGMLTIGLNYGTFASLVSNQNHHIHIAGVLASDVNQNEGNPEKGSSWVLPFINTVTFADGACEARSRREKEAMSGTSSTTRDKEIARNPLAPEGLERDGPISLLLLLADVTDIDSSSRLDLAPSRSQQTSPYL